MNDMIEEELSIAKDQDTQRHTLSSAIFSMEIKNIGVERVITMTDDSLLEDVVKLLQKKHIGSVVLTNDGTISGIFTERDLLMKVVGVYDDWKKIEVKQVMTEDPQCLRPGDEIAYVLNNMHVGGYRHVPIVDEDERPISMISIKDILNWILEFFPEEIDNLTSEPFRGVRTAEGA